MKHLKRIFESSVEKNFKEINQLLLDECDILQDFLDEFEEKGKCSIFITGGYSSIGDFKKFINESIEKPLPSIQYSLSGEFYDSSDILVSWIESIKSRIEDTFGRIDNVNINETHKYSQQFTKSVKGLKKDQKYESSYLITDKYECRFGINITNLKTRYFEANPELFFK
jgi:hypothetical protein